MFRQSGQVREKAAVTEMFRVVVSSLCREKYSMIVQVQEYAAHVEQNVYEHWTKYNSGEFEPLKWEDLERVFMEHAVSDDEEEQELTPY